MYAEAPWADPVGLGSTWCVGLGTPRRAAPPSPRRMAGWRYGVRRVPTPAACLRAMSQTLSFQPPKPPHPLPCTTPSSKLARSSGANLRRARRQPDQRKARAW